MRKQKSSEWNSPLRKEPLPPYDKVAVHRAADLFPLMEGKDLQELAADIQKNGLLQPIIIHKGMILDGRNRYRACLLAGVRPTCKDVDFKGKPRCPPGTSEEKIQELGLQRHQTPVAYVLAANVQRRHLSNKQKNEIIRAALKEDSSLSNRQIAAAAKVDDKTVGVVRAELEACAEIPHRPTRIDSTGRSQPVTRQRPKKTEKTEVVGELALHAEPATSGEAEAPKEAAPQSGGEIRLFGVGEMYAEKAIDWLKQIPKSDPLRSRGLQLVMDWIGSQLSDDCEEQQPASTTTVNSGVVE